MNIGHFFQYRLNYGRGLLLVDDNEFYVTNLDVYPAVVNQNAALGAYLLLYFLVNFFVFLVVNTRIEWSLVRNMRAEIAEKRVKTEEEVAKMKMNSSSHSEVINKVIRGKLKKIEEDAKKEQRAILMVIVNSGLNFVLRLPELLVFFSDSNALFPGNPFYKIFANGVNLNDMTVTISYLMYILTFTTNVAIYYLFNAKFRQLFIFWPHYVKPNDFFILCFIWTFFYS
jgi:hypothetical protein